MAWYLFQLAGHILLPLWSVQDWEESASSFPEFSCSHCITSTSCLVFLPILPAWPISTYLKHDGQNTDYSPAPLPPLFFKTNKQTNKQTKENIHSPFLGNVGVVFQATSSCLGALIILWGPKENLEL